MPTFLWVFSHRVIAKEINIEEKKDILIKYQILIILFLPVYFIVS